MGELYIYLLLFVIPPVVIMIMAARMVLQFSLSNHLKIIGDRLNSVALKSPEVKNEREFAFAKMQNDSYISIVEIGMSNVVAKSLLLNIDDIDRKNRSRRGKKSIDLLSIKNREIKEMTFSSMAAFLGLLAANSITDFFFVFSAFATSLYRQIFSSKNTSIINEVKRKIFSMNRYRYFGYAPLSA